MSASATPVRRFGPGAIATPANAVTTIRLLLAVPTLVLAGRHSLVMGPDAARRATERLPDGQVVIFEDSAHALALEEPARFQDVVAGFVKRGARSS